MLTFSSNEMVFVISDYSCCMYSKFGAYTGGYVPECTTPPPGNEKMAKERYMYIYYIYIHTIDNI